MSVASAWRARGVGACLTKYGQRVSTARERSLVAIRVYSDRCSGIDDEERDTGEVLGASGEAQQGMPPEPAPHARTAHLNACMYTEEHRVLHAHATRRALTAEREFRQEIFVRQAPQRTELADEMRGGERSFTRMRPQLRRHRAT